MTRRIDFDDQLRAWADLGDERLPVQYLNAALAQIDTSPQRRAAASVALPLPAACHPIAERARRDAAGGCHVEP